ncbi:gas vesicle protein K [Halobacteria archaeon AArc-curdl1]|uniref:Gas vesicle protein K n=1 Tax=Natronosalvus hydrolyticus TaxID=2979988 RepID=A0AAP2ZAF0_9EURY|nr:gas vesicle protein K [Halobacteria archaeon AArc-curdl1]
MTTVDIDGDEASTGLVTLVVTVVEILLDALEREAVRRMESGRLADEEIERLGQQLQAIEAEVESLKESEGIEDGVSNLRDDLDGLIWDAIERVDEEAPQSRKPGYTVLRGDHE